MNKLVSNADIVVVSAPSGTGKTTLNRRLVEEYPDKVEVAVSYTTRAIRNQEVDGVHYRFVSKNHFANLLDSDGILEWAKVHDELYGTSIAEVERITQKGKTVILEIDVQGWKQARLKIPNARSIFILPPSVATLWQRLERRGTDELAKRLRRMETARQEVSEGYLYEHFVINDELESAFEALVSIVIQKKPSPLTQLQGREYCERLLQEFSKGPWVENQI